MPTPTTTNDEPSTLGLYLPNADRPDGQALLRQIIPRSAIVGRPDACGDTVTIDFDDNLHNASHLLNFEDRLQLVAERAATNQVTVARLTVAADTIIRIGTARHSNALAAWYLAELDNPAALAAWIAPERAPTVGPSLAQWDRAISIRTGRLSNEAFMRHTYSPSPRSLRQSMADQLRMFDPQLPPFEDDAGTPSPPEVA